MKYTIINLEDIPDDLPPGTYQTRVISATFEEIVLEFIPEEIVDEFRDCLIKLVKE